MYDYYMYTFLLNLMSITYTSNFFTTCMYVIITNDLEERARIFEMYYIVLCIVTILRKDNILDFVNHVSTVLLSSSNSMLF